MDLDSVGVQLEAAKQNVDWKSWLINTGEHDPYDKSSGTLELKATAVLKSGNETKVIGRCELWLIMREKMCYGCFGKQVNEISQHAAYLSKSIFDKFGEYMFDLNAFNGLDLDKADMILLENIWVDEDHRKQGVAGKMLREALKEIEAELDTWFMITYPRPAEDVDESLSWDEKYHRLAGIWSKTMKTFRALGFRIMRTSSFWIYDPYLRHHGQALLPVEPIRSLDLAPDRGMTFYTA